MCEQKGEKPIRTMSEKMQGGDTPQDVVAEYKGQNDPKKATPRRGGTQRDSHDFQPRPPTRPHAMKVEVFGFLLFFSMLFITRLFMPGVELVWMVPGFRSFKRRV